MTDHYINRIEQLDDRLNAVAVRDFDRAREEAAKADRELAAGNMAGPLHGIPLTVKEAFNIAGQATTWGMPVLKDNIADADAEVVKRLTRAGRCSWVRQMCRRGLVTFKLTTKYME